MPQVPLPPEVTQVYDRLVPTPVMRGRQDGDVRSQCDRCSSYVDANEDQGALWLEAHLRTFHHVEVVVQVKTA